MCVCKQITFHEFCVRLLNDLINFAVVWLIFFRFSYIFSCRWMNNNLFWWSFWFLICFSSNKSISTKKNYDLFKCKQLTFNPFLIGTDNTTIYMKDYLFIYNKKQKDTSAQPNRLHFQFLVSTENRTTSTFILKYS